MSELIVTVKHGDVRGVQTESVTGYTYISFRGIPFAAPPIGDLRFRDPQPLKRWAGVRDCSTEGSKCAQFNIFDRVIIGDDDCLYLNVATTSVTGSRPVIVWIHGGAFVLGDGGSDMHSPDYIMGSDVVYVGINYRLGVLGFLNLDHEAAPGNFGLKDQVAALKWVKDNIAQFGGDPNNVTIFGESAGSASVHYLLLSPLAKGLFHKAIMQSGVILNPFATVASTVSMARRYVHALGSDVTDPNEIVEFLRTIPAHRLVEFQEKVISQVEGVNLEFPFGPSVDDKSPEPFMPRPYQELVGQGSDVPVIIGYNSHEGIIFLMGLQDVAYGKMDGNFNIMVPRDLAAKAPSKIPEIAEKIKKLYFGDRPITEDLVDEFVQYTGDLHFVVGIHRVVESLREKKSPTYFYRFSYDPPNSLMKSIFHVEVKGTIHGQELQYLFFATKFREHFKNEPGSTDDILRKRFIRMWTDFAKTGNPTPSIDDLITERWEPVTKTAKNYLEINTELIPGVNPNDDVWQEWKRIYALAEDQ